MPEITDADCGACIHCGEMTVRAMQGDGVDGVWKHANGFFHCAMKSSLAPQLAEPYSHPNPPILLLRPAEQDPENIINVRYPSYDMDGRMLGSIKVGQFCWQPNVWYFWFANSTHGWPRDVIDAVSSEFDKLYDNKNKENDG